LAFEYFASVPGQVVGCGKHLELADGPLFGHELHQLPAHIVLSACELGLARPRPGEETLGMTAALLHGGAGSVVAGVARTADAVAYQVGPAHHAALRDGQSPAAALAARHRERGEGGGGPGAAGVLRRRLVR
jgi:hypothetical protein